MTPASVWARLGYALLFCAVLPALLVAWAEATEDIIGLPPFGYPLLGWALLAIGAVFLLLGMLALWRRGGGLPMNAFPPPRLVVSGIYRLVPHPIYVGFCLACAGVSMAVQSASGLWLVTPSVALGCASLIYGYEVPDLERRFGGEAMRGLRWRPADDPDRLHWPDVARAYLFALLPWLGAYEISVWTAAAKNPITAQLAFEPRLPVWEWLYPIYASAYLVIGAAPLLARSSRDLRRLVLRAFLASAFIFPIYFVFPSIAPRRPFVPTSLPGEWLAWEQSVNSPIAALPSFHVVWAILASELIGSARRAHWLWRVWAGLVALSCVMTGMHTIIDVLAGAVTAAFIMQARALWGRLHSLTERIANSWKEWRVGPVRIINHGFYAGAGVFVAYVMIDTLLGPGHEAILAATAAASMIGAGLWAQLIEGSPRLLRPFGFYGGLFAVILTALAAPLFGNDRWTVLAAWCVAGPWLQAIGRLRCLVQGCCHGKPTGSAAGIRYFHPRSRVCRIAHLDGVPLHPTPLYSIIWNAFIALIVAKLWRVHAPVHMIGGVYLILGGAGRFIEEAYRGEPQTPTYAGLRLYQWIALGTVIAGAVITAVARSSLPAAGQFHAGSLLPAAGFGLLSAFALGVDFPSSDRRFSRLA